MTVCASTETACEKSARKLEEAQEVLHKLNLGARVVRISSGDGKAVEYSPASLSELRRYVSQLQGEVDICNGGCRSGRSAIQLIPGG